ncbi:MAG TPA: signal peptidase I [Rhizomicrobium sp.]|nr:signal peptidase I [Rhizomicrobium sp.]
MRADLKDLLSRQNLKAAWDYVREPVIVAGVLLVSTTAIAQPFYIPSGSMEPTLQIGDGLIATKYDYGYSRYSVPFALGPASETRLLQKAPARGDIVIFRDPSQPSKTLIKRLIGLPGDRVLMVEGRLRINGKELPLQDDGIGTAEGEHGEMYQVARYTETLPNGIKHPIFKQGWDGPLDNTDAFVVPKDHFFMMGDNRDDSLDSRVPVSDGGVGFVPIENLVGHAQIVVGSVDYLGGTQNKGVFERLRASRFFKALY